jgi:hypothetical protein
MKTRSKVYEAGWQASEATGQSEDRKRRLNNTEIPSLATYLTPQLVCSMSAFCWAVHFVKVIKVYLPQNI